jgi:prepilin-type N-terminal cleavage/methylation domain-containing protein
MSKKALAGVTFAELIITLAIFSILLGIGYPMLAQFPNSYRLRAAARELATDLQFARLLAVKENRNFQVICEANSYQVVRVNDGFVAKVRNFSADYPHVGLSDSVITFNSRGNSSAQIITVSNFVTSRNITVSSSGRVKLQ